MGEFMGIALIITSLFGIYFLVIGDYFKLFPTVLLMGAIFFLNRWLKKKNL